MEYTSITKEMQDTIQSIRKCMNQLWKQSIKKAESERDYRVALQKEILTLKAEGMATTLIPDIARGAAADLKFTRDTDEALYNTTKDSLRALQATLNAYQTIVRLQEELERIGPNE